MAVLLATAVPAQAATTFTVNTTLDLPDSNVADSYCDADPLPFNQNLCTLRAAIMEANQEPGADTIEFNIPSTDPGCVGQPWCTITLALLDLPALIDNGTYINGLTQPDSNPGFVGSGLPNGAIPGEIPGYVVNNPCVSLAGGLTVPLNPPPAPLVFPKPDIAINANNAVNAMSIGGNTSDITIRGLAIYNSLQHAILGLAGTGQDRLIDLMFIGPLPQDDNAMTLLVNEQDPVALRNKQTGVRQLSPGFLDVTRSYVGFNGEGGLDGFSNASTVNFLLNETFENGLFSDSHDGIDVNGINSTARCNLAHNNRTLGDVPNGGGGNGIELGSKSASPVSLDNNLVEYNTLRDNVSAGLSVRKGPRGNFHQRNVASGNLVGISINTEGRLTNKNELAKNSTFDNFELGIDLQHLTTFATDPVTGEPTDEVIPWQGSPDGPTPNDHCDADGGVDGSGTNTASNDLQNHPELSSAFTFNGQTQVQGFLDSTPLRRYRIEFFSTPGGLLFGPLDREGMVFIGQTFVVTDANCVASFNPSFSTVVPDGDVITATATRDEVNDSEPWSTSEYSAPMDVNLFVADGKVTGGGWFFQPDDAMPTPPSSDRRANFGFNAQYHKDNPTPKGHTNFMFRSDSTNLHLNSLAYEPFSLIVEQNPDGTGWARWRGTAKVGNDPNYCFRAYVEDNNEPGTDDEWHIRIWRKDTSANSCSNESLAPIYDNFPANGPHGPGQGTVIKGGNIQLHPPNP